MQKVDSVPIKIQFTADSPFKVTALIIFIAVIILIIVCGASQCAGWFKIRVKVYLPPVVLLR